MKKLAIYVEGPTESFFVKRLFEELVNRNKIHIKECSSTGGAKGPRVLTVLAEDAINAAQEYFINIHCSNADNRVNQDVKDNIATLCAQGYSLVIALKDLRGDYGGKRMKPQDAPLFKILNQLAFSGSPISVKSVIAIMEIESWFLSETSHFERIDPILTQAFITSNSTTLSADPYKDDVEQVEEPTELLREIYRLAGKTYCKDKSHRERTIKALDMAEIYLNLPYKVKSLKEFVDTINSFL